MIMEKEKVNNTHDLLYEENFEFFKWIFGEDFVNIDNTVDLSLAEDFDDCNIYYPHETIGEFLETDEMKKISRIMQLSSVVNSNKHAYHTRYEHCLGVYNQKKNIILNLYKNDTNFRKNIEENHLQVYIIAELIKSLAHDIGHLAQSHVIDEVTGFKGFHELLGVEILMKDPQIQKVFEDYDLKHPNNPVKLSQALAEIINQDTIDWSKINFNSFTLSGNKSENQKKYRYNFSLIDEGNYDIDRFDYITRDLFHRGKLRSLTYQKEDGNEVPLRSFEKMSMEHVVYNGEDMYVPVFDINSIPAIEAFLNSRVDTYKELYYSPYNKIRDSLVAKFTNYLLNSNTEKSPELIQFLSSLKSQSQIYKETNDVNSINLNVEDYLPWDDIHYFSQIIDLLDSSDNLLRLYASLILPNLISLMDMAYYMLDYKNQKEKISNSDKEFLKKIKKLTKHNNDLIYKNLKYNAKPDKFDSQIIKKDLSKDPLDRYIICTSDPQVIRASTKWPDEIKSKITYNTKKIKGYKPSEPIFIKGKNGEIYPIEQILGRKFNVSTEPEEVMVAYVFLPDLDDISITANSFPGFIKPSQLKYDENENVDTNLSLFSIVPGSSTISPSDTFMTNQFTRRFDDVALEI